jgi:two-component system aerobic respiration control protein ArcA
MFLTGRDNEVDKILGLEIGADDYITKPFNPRELTIRARNLLSRTMNLGTVSEERRSVESYKFNGWELDINSRSLIGPDGEQYKLPRSEFRAMLHFCENPGKIQSRAELLKKMTGRELKPHDRTVDVTIRRIRKHFESRRIRRKSSPPFTVKATVSAATCRNNSILTKKRRNMRRFSFHHSISISETRHLRRLRLRNFCRLWFWLCQRVPVKMTRQEHHATQRHQQHAGSQQ